MKQAIGYVRVSTGGQDVEAQRAAINAAAAKEGVKVRGFTEETISSRKTDRRIYTVVNELQEGDILIVYELSRLARSIGEVFEIVQMIRRRGATLWVLKPELRTGTGIGGDDLRADMLMFALGTAAQIERDLISERTKSGLRARQSAGVRLGRPVGRGRLVEKVVAEKGLAADALREGYRQKIVSAAAIARMLGIDQRTVRAWLKGAKDARVTN